MPLPAIAAVALKTAPYWLPALGQLGSSLIQRQGQKKANEANERLAENQAKWNQEQWERQNAYNDPAAQMARLQGAGLNPRFIYGSGASGASGTAGDVKGYDRAEAKNINEGLYGFADITNNLLQAVQTDNVKAMTDVHKEEAQLKRIDQLSKNIDNETKTFDLGLKKDLRETNVEFQREITNKAREEALRSQQEAIQSGHRTQISEATRQTLIDQAKTQLEIAMQSLQGQKLENAIKEITLSLNTQGLSWNDPKWMRILSQYGLEIKNFFKEQLPKAGITKF
jgi:hypothetical protein